MGLYNLAQQRFGGGSGSRGGAGGDGGGGGGTPYDSSAIGGRGAGMSRGLGLGLGLGAKKRAGFRSAVNTGTLDSYLGDRPGLQQQFDARTATPGAGPVAQNYQSINRMNQTALAAPAPAPAPGVPPAPGGEDGMSYAGGTPGFDETAPTPGMPNTLPAGGGSQPMDRMQMLQMLMRRRAGGGLQAPRGMLTPSAGVSQPDWSRSY